MQDKVVVMTGATSGIGIVAAERLAAMGARLVLVARDRARGEAALERLRRQPSRAAHRVHYADLSKIADTRRVAAELAAAEPRIDVLANNAGALFGRRGVTDEGLERTFALNHLSYYVLTHGLRARLTGHGAARIVNTSSAAHRRALRNLTDWQSERSFLGFEAYARSKLFNILFTRELARRLAGTGVTANAHHPGFVATRFGDESGGLLSLGVRAAKWFALTPEQGADTLVYLATAPEAAAESGQYFQKRRRRTPSASAQDDALARQLWAETERISGLAW
jgi:NAD(P)-dependent dehydrogenase (short-subunit alcohol dehydrogenase family)